MRRLALLSLVTALATESRAETRVSAGAGVEYLEKRTPFAVREAVPGFLLSVAQVLSEESAASLRLHAVPLEGRPDVAVALGIELRVWRWGGFLGEAGIAGDAWDRLGSVLGAGAFASLPLDGRLGLRVEVVAAKEVRADFGGLRVGAVLGVEWTWEP